MRRILFLAVLLLAAAAASPAADLARVLEQDFAPIEGEVIAVRTEDFLINLDASSGIRIGEVFAVIRPGESVTDPRSGQVLGVEETVVAALRVSEISGGFSHAAPIGHAGAIRMGDRVRRYAKVQAHFWDYTDGGERLFTQVRDALPGMRWVDYAVAQGWRPESPSYAADGSSLYFILQEGVLEVRDGEGRLIRAYDVIAEGPGQARFTTSARLREPTISAAPTGMTAVAAAQSTALPFTAAWPAAQSPAAGPGAPSEPIAELPDPVLIGDFYHDGTQDLVAASDGNAVWVFALDDDLTSLASWAPSSKSEIVMLRWWRPSVSETYLALTTWDESTPRGVVLRYDAQGLERIDELESYVIGTFDRDGDGTSETLLRQAFDTDLFFGRRVDVVSLADGRLRHQSLEEDLPRNFTVTGSQWVDLTGDGDAELLVIKNGYLFVYDHTELLYQSPRQAGGSTSTLNYNATPGLKDFRLETAQFELSPVGYDIDGDGTAEAILAASKGKVRFLPGIATGVDESWLATVRYENGRFQTRPMTEIFEHPIQGFGLSRNGLHFIVKDELPRSSLAGRGTIYRFPLYRR